MAVHAVRAPIARSSRKNLPMCAPSSGARRTGAVAARENGRTRGHRRATLLMLVVGLASGCGLGTYDDNGSPFPGQWWPWVCPDGSPAPDAGCPDAACPDGGCAAEPDGGNGS